MQPELELHDNPEVASATTQPQDNVVFLLAPRALSVSGHHLGGHRVSITRPSTSNPANQITAEGEPANAGLSWPRPSRMIAHPITPAVAHP